MKRVYTLHKKWNNGKPDKGYPITNTGRKQYISKEGKKKKKTTASTRNYVI